MVFFKIYLLFFLIKPRNTHESSCERFLTNWIETTEHEMEKDENEKNHRMEIFPLADENLSLSQHPRSSCAQVAMMNTRWFFDVGKLSQIFSHSLTSRWCFQHFFLFIPFFPLLQIFSLLNSHTKCD